MNTKLRWGAFNHRIQFFPHLGIQRELSSLPKKKDHFFQKKPVLTH